MLADERAFRISFRLETCDDRDGGKHRFAGFCGQRTCWLLVNIIGSSMLPVKRNATRPGRRKEGVRSGRGSPVSRVEC